MKDTIHHPEESLEIIRSMIARTRKSFHNNSFYFLLWGVLMFLAGITEFMLLKYTTTAYFWIGWPGYSLVGGVVSALYANRQEKSANGESFTDTVVGYIWLAYGISLVCLIATAILVNVNPAIFVLLLTGLPTFLTGFILRHNPLKFGGVVFWVAGITSIFTPELYVPLIFSGAIVLGYLLPGLSLMNTEKNQHV